MVAEKIISQIEAGLAPWQRPWNPGDSASVLPVNPVTGKRYRGINSLWLLASGYEDSRWMTYKQAQALGAQVRKGEKGTQIQYWKMTEDVPKADVNGEPVLDKDGRPEKTTVRLDRPRVFLASVFNAEQVEGLPERIFTQAAVQPAWEVLDRAEALIRASGARLVHKEQDTAFYRESDDTIYLPNLSQFETAGKYYATALHELGHWTGHESRLARDLNQPHGSEGYAREELRAEIASMMLGHELGVGHDPGQHAAYAGAWVEVLRRDSFEIFRAAADAEKIYSHVMTFDIKLQKQLDEDRAMDAIHLNEPTAEKSAVTVHFYKTARSQSASEQKEADELIAKAAVKGDWSQASQMGKKHLGFAFPSDWNGSTEVRGCVKESDSKVRSQLNPGETAEFYGLYLNRRDGSQRWVADFESAPEAFRLGTRLNRIYHIQQEVQAATRAVAPSVAEKLPVQKEKVLQM